MVLCASRRVVVAVLVTAWQGGAAGRWPYACAVAVVCGMWCLRRWRGLLRRLRMRQEGRRGMVLVVERWGRGTCSVESVGLVDPRARCLMRCCSRWDRSRRLSPPPLPLPRPPPRLLAVMVALLLLLVVVVVVVVVVM